MHVHSDKPYPGKPYAVKVTIHAPYTGYLHIPLQLCKLIRTKHRVTEYDVKHMSFAVYYRSGYMGCNQICMPIHSYVRPMWVCKINRYHKGLNNMPFIPLNYDNMSFYYNYMGYEINVGLRIFAGTNFSEFWKQRFFKINALAIRFIQKYC